MATSLLALWINWRFRHDTANTFNHAVLAAPYDVVIIPGIPFDGVKSNKLLAVRFFWAKELYDRGLVKNIIFSGGAVHTPYVEGKVMQIMADSLGISPLHIFNEIQASHSDENVYFGWQLAKKLGFSKIAVATDAYQAFFLKGFIERKMPGVMELPLQADSIPKYIRPLPVIDARDAFTPDFVPLEKRETWWERFKHSFPGFYKN